MLLNHLSMNLISKIHRPWKWEKRVLYYCTTKIFNNYSFATFWLRFFFFGWNISTILRLLRVRDANGAILTLDTNFKAIHNAKHKLIFKSNFVPNHLILLACHNSSNPKHPLVGICSVQQKKVVWIYIFNP